MFIVRIEKIFIFVLIFSLLFVSKLNAQSSEVSRTQELDSYLRYMPSRTVNAMSGKVGICEFAADYSNEFKVFDKLPVKFSVGNKIIGIENSTYVKLPAHLIGVTTDIETTLPFFNTENTYLRLGISPSLYGDDLDFQTSNFRMPMRFFLIHLPDEQWTWIFGLAIYPDYEIQVWPIMGFIYKANDKLTFNIVPERPNISYILDEKVTIFAEGGSSFDEYEVDKENLDNVVLCYRELHLGAGIEYKFDQNMSTSFSLGAIFNRSLKYRDSLGKVNIKNGIYTEIRFHLKF